ncbi:MAG: gliding motility lipoprotein GldH [Odoribacter sp.]|nr:gliding motility lipoprotein GldH [Odoribacter sp.]
MKKYILFLGVLLHTACQSPAVFEQYEELSGESWNRNHIIEFKAQIPDSGLYNVILSIRHTTDFETANLWSFISTRTPNGRTVKDTVNLLIAEPDGRWLGKGGSIKTVEQPLKRNPVVLPGGEVSFSIEQGMRIEEMQGVKNVGIRIEQITEE